MTEMKRTAKALAAIFALYLLISIALTVLVSFGVCRWDIIRHHSPFLLSEVVISTVHGYNAQFDQVYGYDQHGDYICLDDDRVPGETVITFFVWNPFNNYVDDTILHYDF